MASIRICAEYSLLANSSDDGARRVRRPRSQHFVREITSARSPRLKLRPRPIELFAWASQNDASRRASTRHPGNRCHTAFKVLRGSRISRVHQES